MTRVLSATGKNSETDRLVAELVEELADRLRSDPAADVESFLREHEALADRLRLLLPAVAMMAELGRAEVAGVGLSSADSDDQSSHGVDVDEASSGGGMLAAHSSTAGVLGDFRIVREIGRGGMGIVYEAEQISLARRVALKVLPFAAMLDARHLQRFRNEAQAAAQLHHTNIVPVYAVGCERGVHYYAMQYIAGQTLEAVIDSLASRGRRPSDDRVKDVESVEGSKNAGKSLPPFVRGGQGGSLRGDIENCKLKIANRKLATTRVAARGSTSPDRLPREYFLSVAELGIQAAEALDYAHERGVVHRDVKPSNLILDEDGNLWVTDFGLARVESDTNLTMSGDILGTLRYMSPEQALARRPLLDHRTDIYSLGVTLFELLTLRPAFPETDRAALLSQIASNDPPRLRRVDPAIPAELETIVQKAIEKDPAARYETASDLAGDLRHFLEDRPIKARPPRLYEQAFKWSRRHRSLVRSVSAAAVAIALCAAVAAVMIDHARHEARLDHARQQARVGFAEQESRLARITLEADRKTALAEKRSLDWFRYVMQINRANQSFQQGQFADARRHLAECRPEAGEQDLRGIEWHYLWNATSARGRFVAHLGPVYRMTFSPDGRMLATGGIDGVRVWEYKSRRPIRYLPHGGVGAVAFSPDGRSMATAGADGTARIWSTTKWTIDRRLPIEGLVFALGYFADGGRLGSARRPFDAFGHKFGDESIQFWDTDTWELHDVLPQHDDNHRRIIGGSRDGGLLALRGDDNTTCIWDVQKGVRKYTLPGSEVVDRVVFAHQSGLMAAVTEEGSIALRDARDGSVRTLLPGLVKGLEDLDFSQDDSIVAAVADRLLYVWEKRAESSYVNTRVFRGDSRFWSVKFAPDEENTLLTTNHAGVVQRWGRGSAQQALTVQCEESWPIDLRFSPDGRWAVTAGPGVQAHALDSSAMPIAVAPENGSPWHAEFSPDSRLLAAFNRDVGVAIWDVEDWAPLRQIPVRGVICRQLRFFMPDRRLLVVPADADHQWFDIDSGQVVRAAATADRVKPPLPEVSPARFSASRKWGMLEVRNGNGTLWTLDAPMLSWTAHAFSNDGAKFAASLNDGTISMWDTADQASRRTIVGKIQRPRALAISNDQRTLASEGPDNTVTLWNVATGLELLSLDPGLEQIDELAFTLHGNHLVARGIDRRQRRAAVIWPTEPDEIR